jgi:zinc protease
MIELHWTEIEGVTTIWTDAPPPLRVGLLFRTGLVDETLASSGCTHLIEHLALAPLGDPSDRHNGSVGSLITSFFTLGQPQEVVDFLESICAGLGSLPSDRLEAEKGVLAAEAATRPGDFRATLLTRRCGAVGYGLLGLPQFGYQKATLEGLLEFSSGRFCRENALLWLSGPPPAGLSLDLPAGKQLPLPPLLPLPEAFPCWFVDRNLGGAAAGSIVPRVSEATLFSQIALQRLRQHLRAELSLSYAPAVYYDHLNADTAHLVIFADSDQEHRQQLTAAFGEVFEGLDQIQDAEVKSSLEELREHWLGNLAPPLEIRQLMEVQRAAADAILGREFQTTEELMDEAMRVTAESIAGYAVQVKDTAIFALPSGAEAQQGFGEGIPISKIPAVKGRRIPSRSMQNRQQLVCGREGVSLLYFGGGPKVTVRYAELAGALLYEDGGVQLIGSDAAAVMVEPTLWRGGKRVCQQIRENIPDRLVLERPSRPLSAIPNLTAWQRLLRGGFKQLTPIRKIAVILYLLFLGTLVISFIAFLLMVLIETLF